MLRRQQVHGVRGGRGRALHPGFLAEELVGLNF